MKYMMVWGWSCKCFVLDVLYISVFVLYCNVMILRLIC